jgi:hypothetical protein
MKHLKRKKWFHETFDDAAWASQSRAVTNGSHFIHEQIGQDCQVLPSPQLLEVSLLKRRQYGHALLKKIAHE